jgi:hypothetical protein
VEEYPVESADAAFVRSREQFETLVTALGSPETGIVTHAELEARFVEASIDQVGDNLSPSRMVP